MSCNYITIRAYVVLAQGVPIVVTDSFQKAIEAAEVHAGVLAAANDAALAAAAGGVPPAAAAPASPNVAFLMDSGGGATPAQTPEGYFGKWKCFSDADGVADMAMFRRYKKPDGYVATGAWREKPLAGVATIDATVISVRAVFAEYFGGHYQTFEADRALQPGERLSRVTVESDDDEDSRSSRSSCLSNSTGDK